MNEVLGNNFFFDWEIRLMEWLQSAVGSEGPLLSILSSLSAFGEQLLLVVVMGFLYCREASLRSRGLPRPC